MTKEAKNEMSFIDHLEELRWHLIRAFAAIFVITIGVFLAKSFVFGKVILGPTQPDFSTYNVLCKLGQNFNLGDSFCYEALSFSLTNIDMAGQFLIHLKTSFVLGFIVAFPYVLFEIWNFVKPGLYDSEKKYTRGIVTFGSLFFFLGVLFGYFILTPFSINFLGSYFVSPEVTNTINLSSYIQTITTLVLASGMVFELPMIVFILAKLGLVTAGDMRKYRKHGFVSILLFSAIITPPDLTSQIIIAFPLYILYELSIFIAAKFNPVKKIAEESLAKT